MATSHCRLFCQMFAKKIFKSVSRFSIDKTIYCNYLTSVLKLRKDPVETGSFWCRRRDLNPHERMLTTP